MLYLSVVFTWDLPDARRLAEASKLKVRAGGPAVSIMPDYLADVAEVGGDLPYRPLDFHNPMATFTTRGCPNQCGFCAVHRLEPEFIELDDFPVRPVVCDNNLLAASEKHFDRVIDRLKALPFVDFNQGLEAERFEPYHAKRISEIKSCKVRFACDSLDDMPAVSHAITISRQHDLNDIGIYVLIGFNDTPDEAIEKLEWVRSMKIYPNPMRFQPLNSFVKNEFLAPGWTKRKILDVQRYYSRLGYWGDIPFKEYKRTKVVASGNLF